MEDHAPPSAAARLLRFVPERIRAAGRRAAFRVPLPLRLGTGFRRARSEMRRTEWLPSDVLAAIADAKVRRLVAHCDENVPYYRELFRREGIDARAIRGRDDLKRIPILTKEILRERFEDLKSRDFARHGARFCQTGGSTGARTRYFISQRTYDAELGALWRHYNQVGFRTSDRCVSLYLPLEGAAAHLPYYDNPRTHKRELNTAHLTREKFKAMIDHALAHGAEVLWSYPSHLALLCRYMAETGDRRFQPRVVVTNAEVLYDWQRAEAREVLGCDVFDWYGLGEHVAIAAECERHGYHIPEEIVVVEVIAGTDEAPPGERGEIVGTSLENYAQPLIRYRTGDYAVRRAGRCPCGRAHAMLREIGGRTQDVITTPQGYRTFRHGLCAFDEIPGLEAVQIEQVSLERLIVRYVAPRGIGERGEERLREMIVSGVGFSPDMEFTRVPEVPRTSRGKHQLVISRVPMTFLGERAVT